MLDLALSLDKELGEAVRIAHTASAILRDARVSALDVKRKQDDSIVTEADLASDEFIRGELTRLFPDDGILSEESAYLVGKSGRTWIIDPLDGTRGYSQGGNDYAIHIGLVSGGEAVLGVVAEPETKRIYRALKGVGTFLSSDVNGTMRQLRVSKKVDFRDMTLVASSRYPEEQLQALATSLGTASISSAPSVGCKIGRLTRREADLYFSAHPVSYWDSCAPKVILEAAGGVITTPSQEPLTYVLEDGSFIHDTPIVASNGRTHALFCERVCAHIRASD
jgi:3'(2'), 5'-bisphosphate nucleotidase